MAQVKYQNSQIAFKVKGLAIKTLAFQDPKIGCFILLYKGHFKNITGVKGQRWDFILLGSQFDTAILSILILY